MEKAEGSITVTPPSELDNADPFVLDTMTVRVPTKIIGRTVEYNRADLNEEACAGMVKVQEEMLSNAKITALSKGPNVASWNSYLAKYLDMGATWNKLPWYVAEASSTLDAYILYITWHLVSGMCIHAYVAETPSRLYAYILYIIWYVCVCVCVCACACVCVCVCVCVYTYIYIQDIIHDIQYTGTSQRPMSITVSWRPQAHSQKYSVVRSTP